MSSEIVPERLSTKNVFLGKKNKYNLNLFSEITFVYSYFIVFRHVALRQPGGGPGSSVPGSWTVNGVRSSGGENI